MSDNPGRIECLFDWKSLGSLEHVELSGNLRLFVRFDFSDIMLLRNLKGVLLTHMGVMRIQQTNSLPWGVHFGCSDLMCISALIVTIPFGPVLRSESINALYTTTV